MNEPAQPSVDQARSAAAAIVAPDPVTAGLLAKHSAGEKLTQSEYGKLGALASKAKRLFSFGGPTAQPAAARPRESAPVGAVAPSEASGSGLVAPTVDAGIAQRTTGTLLTRIEAVARRKLTNAAREAGASDKEVSRFDAAARLPSDDKSLLIELAPDVARELGVDPKRYCLWVFFGTLGMWGTDIWLAVDELKAMRGEKTPAPPKSEVIGAAPYAPQPPAATKLPGAPPDVRAAA